MIQPHSERLLVRCLDEALEPEATAPPYPHRGRVIASERGLSEADDGTWAVSIALGDHVVFPRGVGTAFEIDGRAHFLICAGDVLAVLA